MTECCILASRVNAVIPYREVPFSSIPVSDGDEAFGGKAVCHILPSIELATIAVVLSTLPNPCLGRVQVQTSVDRRLAAYGRKSTAYSYMSY